MVGTYHLQGRQPLPLGRSPVSFEQIGMGSVFQRKSQDKGPSSLIPCPWWCIIHGWQLWTWFGTFTCTCTAPWGMVVGTLPSSGEAAPTKGKVPCEFWADWPNFIFQPAAPDMIWHIYSRQHCFKGILGMDLLSSGDVALTMGQVPCEFWADWPNFIFQLAAVFIKWQRLL